jgi:hypothetical protein
MHYHEQKRRIFLFSREGIDRRWDVQLGIEFVDLAYRRKQLTEGGTVERCVGYFQNAVKKKFGK